MRRGRIGATRAASDSSGRTAVSRGQDVPRAARSGASGAHALAALASHLPSSRSTMSASSAPAPS
eukprot:6197911-Pleurochrysis_carterae.AAC.1